jgi:hypothetical protein
MGAPIARLPPVEQAKRYRELADGATHEAERTTGSKKRHCRCVDETRDGDSRIIFCIAVASLS